MVATFLYPGNDSTIVLSGLSLQTDGSMVTGATVTATLVDRNGVNVSGAVNISLSDLSGTPGTYTGIIPNTVTLTPGTGYMLQITAIKSGLQLKASHPITIVNPRLA